MVIQSKEFQEGSAGIDHLAVGVQYQKDVGNGIQDLFEEVALLDLRRLELDHFPIFSFSRSVSGIEWLLHVVSLRYRCALAYFCLVKQRRRCPIRWTWALVAHPADLLQESCQCKQGKEDRGPMMRSVA